MMQHTLTIRHLFQLTKRVCWKSIQHVIWLTRMLLHIHTSHPQILTLKSLTLPNLTFEKSSSERISRRTIGTWSSAVYLSRKMRTLEIISVELAPLKTEEIIFGIDSPRVTAVRGGGGPIKLLHTVARYTSSFDHRHNKMVLPNFPMKNSGKIWLVMLIIYSFSNPLM